MKERGVFRQLIVGFLDKFIPDDVIIKNPQNGREVVIPRNKLNDVETTMTQLKSLENPSVPSK
jgi:hypothetical protein